MADQEQGEQGGEHGREWDPRAHLERIRAVLPEDGSMMPMDEVTKRLGLTSVSAVTGPVLALCWAILGMKLWRSAGGKFLGMSRYTDYSHGREATAKFAQDLGYHGAARTPPASSETPEPSTGASQNGPRYSRD